MSDQAIQTPSNPPARQPGSSQSRVRLWPGIVLVTVLLAARGWLSIGEFSPLKFFVGMLIVPLAVGAGLILWWLFASRLRWSDRLQVVGTLAAMTAVVMLAADSSFRGMGLLIYALPITAAAWLGWLVLSCWFPWPVRQAGVLLVFVVVGVGCCLARINGMDGNFTPKFSWRWIPTPEQKLLVALQGKAAPGMAGAGEISEQPGDWPGFRGPRRDNRLAGVRIKTDWQQSPPKELWRHAVGPGWSSFAVVGDRIYTQEQRGDDENVVCYDAASGAEVWIHRDATRFSEVAAGPGPRATPTFHTGRVYALGANGHLNCLDAASGKHLWLRDVVADCKATVPQWGFASSPLVAHGVVAVFAGAPNGKTIAAYDEQTGEPAWTASVGPTSEKASLSYCSPHLATLEGTEQILFTTDAGLSGFDPPSGKEFWHYSWPVPGVARIVQPAIVGNDVLLGTGMGNGTRRIHVAHNGETWLAEEQWTSRQIRPYFNDLVVLNDHLYGFDAGKFVCVDLKEGKEAWHVRGYGSGQVLLLADQELLVVLSEEGDVALVSARPDKHEELCRFKALEGKTWNHPVIAHGKLFVRNGEEMACFRLGLLDESDAPKKVAAAAE